jgi:general secretion pathway protein L
LTDALLLFLGRAGGIDGWLHLENGAVAARGQGADPPPPAGSVPVAAIVPGDSVALHWLDLPAGLAPAQAAAAARLAAVDYSAQPLADMHVAVGRSGDGGAPRCVALASAAAMTGWLEGCRTAGFDPDLILPETLLLAPPEEGFTRFDRGSVSLYRGAFDAFAVEPELAAPLLLGQAVRDLDGEAFEAGLAAALDRPLVNLRQGAFARRRDWSLDRALVRRLALLAAAILLVSLAIQAVSILRYTFAADSLEREARQVASAALPRSPGVTDASSELGRRLIGLRGGGLGFAATAAPVFAAIRDTANAELASLAFTPDGTLRANVQADTPATVAALAARIEAAGFAVESGPLRGAGGRQAAELIVRPR